MHDGWEEVQLGDVATFLSGGTPKKDEGSYWGGDIPWISGATLIDRRLHSSDRRLTLLGVENGSRIAPAGATLVLVRGMSLLEEIRIGQATRDLAFNQDVKALVPAPTVDAWFLTYALLARRPELLRMVHQAGHGTGVLATDRLRALSIEVPPAKEQRRIAGVLGALDDLIDVNHRIRTTLYRKGVALVEDLVLRQPHRDVVMLEDATSLIETGRRPRGGVSGISEGVPSIGAESIDGLGVFDFSKTKFVPADFAAQMRAGLLESRDVLIYKDGGKPGDFRPHVGMYGDGFPFARMTINEHVYRVRAAAPLTEPFLYFWLSTETSMAAMRRLSTGAAIPGLNSTALKSIPVAIPPAEIQERLFPALEALVGEALAAASEAQRLAKARDELLPLLLSGQVRVVDVAA